MEPEQQQTDDGDCEFADELGNRRDPDLAVDFVADQPDVVELTIPTRRKTV